jgi:hypothetical protein
VPITSIGPPEFIIHAIGTGANTQCRYGEHSEPGLFPQRHRRCVPAKDELVLAYLDKVDGIWTGQLHAAAEAAGPHPADQAARGLIAAALGRVA